ncbi:acyl carrier protein [Streptomyces sp. NPDC102451]|uniref:acyl carrier protein n=1 Tax=Streptomyces sp. NPDC102451 TaxID=3366177 RepID=UPI0037F499A2
MGADERARLLGALVRTHVAAVLGHPDVSAGDVDKGFLELGLDSLTAVELGPSGTSCAAPSAPRPSRSAAGRGVR